VPFPIPFEKFCWIGSWNKSDEALINAVFRATVLMNNLLDHPENFYNEIRRYTASVASVLVFGHRGPTFESFWAHVWKFPDIFVDIRANMTKGVYDVMSKVRT
jgi:hypothetical protein